jgi:uncharacterized protein
MKKPDRDIVEFIRINKVATVCCCAENLPYCFNCFYSFLENEVCLVYKSDVNTKHSQIIINNFNVAGTITAPLENIKIIKGVQFEGIVLHEKSEFLNAAYKSYYSKFPFAIAVPGRLYVIRLNSIKFTDNSRGFGSKEYWNRLSEEHVDI